MKGEEDILQQHGLKNTKLRKAVLSVLIHAEKGLSHQDLSKALDVEFDRVTLFRTLHSFEDAGIPLRWEGKGVDEKGYCRDSGKLLVAVDPRYFRPTEVELLIGDPSKAREKLGWTHHTSPRDLAREMVQADLKVMRDAPIGKGV